MLNKSFDVRAGVKSMLGLYNIVFSKQMCELWSESSLMSLYCEWLHTFLPFAEAALDKAGNPLPWVYNKVVKDGGYKRLTISVDKSLAYNPKKKDEPEKRKKKKKKKKKKRRGKPTDLEMVPEEMKGFVSHTVAEDRNSTAQPTSAGEGDPEVVRRMTFQDDIFAMAQFPLAGLVDPTMKKDEVLDEQFRLSAAWACSLGVLSWQDRSE